MNAPLPLRSSPARCLPCRRWRHATGRSMAENARLVRHRGRRAWRCYGGNANLHHCSLSDFGQMLDMLAADAWTPPRDSGGGA